MLAPAECSPLSLIFHISVSFCTKTSPPLSVGMQSLIQRCRKDLMLISDASAEKGLRCWREVYVMGQPERWGNSSQAELTHWWWSGFKSLPCNKHIHIHIILTHYRTRHLHASAPINWLYPIQYIPCLIESFAPGFSAGLLFPRQQDSVEVEGLL